MADSVVAICNQALDALGVAEIASITEANPQARACNRNYPDARDFALRAIKPNCCTARTASLNRDATGPAWGFTFFYTLPPDYLYMLQVGGLPEPQYRIENDKIATDEAALDIKYAFRQTDPVKFEPDTARAIAQYLAWMIAEKLTGSRARKADMLRDYLLMAGKARGTAQTEGGLENNEARFGWYDSLTRAGGSRPGPFTVV